MYLEFTGINKYFDDFHVLQDVSFKVTSGQIFGFLGRNGAGKTTSLRILMDVFKANSGEITLDNKPFIPNDYKIGYLPEERGMYYKTKVYDQLMYFAMLRKATRKEADRSVRYWAKRFDIEQYLNRKLETLSKGNQQKVQITQAFLNEPDILILDEPFSGLDPVNSDAFQKALLEFVSDNKIIIFSSHQMPYVETFCDDIAIIEEGKIVLEGALVNIKKAWGKNKISVSFEEELLETHLDSLLNNGYLVEKFNGEYLIQTSETASKQELLKTILDSGINLASFQDYTPSLQEIFVKTVGGEK